MVALGKGRHAKYKTDVNNIVYPLIFFFFTADLGKRINKNPEI